MATVIERTVVRKRRIRTIPDPASPKVIVTGSREEWIWSNGDRLITHYVDEPGAVRRMSKAEHRAVLEKIEREGFTYEFKV